MKKHDKYRIILSGGGTGGHIFPAVAIANEIRRMDPSVDILFVGATGKMEMDQVPRAGYPIVGLPVSAFHRRLSVRNLLFPFRLLASMIKAARVISRFRPNLVIGTGGFASGPVLRVASWKRIPTLIQEQNSFPGVTNRLLAHKAARICVAFEGMEKYFPADKLSVTGNPVRSGLTLAPDGLESARKAMGVSGKVPVVLVFGGSQGARTLNLSLLNHLEKLAKAPVEILWQTGRAFYSTAMEAVKEKQADNIRVMEFIYDMNLAYGVSDLVVCRSGAISLSEIALLGKPAILVPLPSAAEDHQTRNAETFVRGGAALMVPDSRAPETLVDTLLELAADPVRRAQLSANLAPFAKPDATKEIAQYAMNELTTG